MMSQMSGKADTEGFIAAYPDGTGNWHSRMEQRQLLRQRTGEKYR